MTHTDPRPASCCAFVGADVDAARACGELRAAGVPAEMVEGAGNMATGALGDGYSASLGGSWLAAVMVATADLERALEVLADFACGRPLDPLDFGRPLAAAAGRFSEADHRLIADLVAEVAAIYGDRLQAVKLVGSRARGEARPDSDWDFLVFLDACEHEVEVPRMAGLGAALERDHRCAPLSLSPLSREQFLGLDAKFEGIAERFRGEAIDLGPVATPGGVKPNTCVQGTGSGTTPRMRFDLAMVSELCEEVGLRCVRRSPDEVGLQLEPGVTLLFQNAPTKDDCLVGFEGTQWHTHDGLTCSDRHGYYVELSYLDLVTGLADGTVLVCELWACGVLADRWLVHRDFVDEFRYMQDGDEIRIRTMRRRGPGGRAQSAEGA